MSLERLINLAKKTGDRLIVHDPVAGRDIVILDVDTYEELVLGGAYKETVSHESVSNEDMGWPNTEELAEEEATWESTGEILADRYRGWGAADERPKTQGVSFVDDMWSEPGEAMHDAAEERKAERPVPFAGAAEEDEPVFYEEPIA